jgi:ABC-type glycerol-3-phosphate transport system permease component
MAFALIASLPVILMFLLVQRWFIAGLTAGAVKG